MGPIRLLLLLLLLGAGGMYSVGTRKLTMTAAFTGVLLALLVYGGAGFAGVAMMAVFFLAGTAATSWKIKWKRQQGLAENEKGTRTSLQVIANAGVAAIAGLISMINPSKQALMQLIIAAAFAAATADTLSSELGNVYGRRFYNILGFKKDQRGLNGVISVEGSLCGLAGSILIAGVYAAGAWTPGSYIAGFGIQSRSVLIIIVAGTIGNIFDSILGAGLERRQYIGNNTVNFLNTALAALNAWLLASFI